MIDKKFILYTALGMLVFLLWEQWQKDYHPPQQQLTVNQQAGSSANATTKLPALPIAALINTTTSKPSTALMPAAMTPSQLLTVKTDQLELVINKHGGNIIAAKLLQYPVSLGQSAPFELLTTADVRYYLVNSGVFSSDNKFDDQQFTYQAAQPAYSLPVGTDQLIVPLTLTRPDGLVIHKRFVLHRGRYDIQLAYQLDNRSNSRWQGSFYTEIKRKDFEPKAGLFGVNTYSGAALSSPEIPYEKLSFEKIAEATKNNKELIREVRGGWIAMQQRYFLTSWIPNQQKNYQYFSRLQDQLYSVGFVDKQLSIAPGEQLTVGATLYMGPAIAANLKALHPNLKLVVDYGWLWFIATWLFSLLEKIHLLVNNWGWAIILLTVAIKLLFYKLTESSCRSMSKMRLLMPKMQALKERYRDDRQGLHQATMELYKSEKINPMNLGGCLPLLLQIPVFIALYYVLISAVELRHAPFCLWIRDLSAHDPYYVLPIIMGFTMLVQQRLTPSSSDPMQAKVMLMMPVIFTLFFLNFPAGLVLYWIVNNALSIAQQWYINKKLTLPDGRVIKSC